jgi:hypothetical protein
MAARKPVLISEHEYLTTAYQPDCEFEDGVLIERNTGTEKHSWMQAALAAYIFRRRRAWNVNVYTEQRTGLRPSPRPTTPIFTKRLWSRSRSFHRKIGPYAWIRQARGARRRRHTARARDAN